MKMRKKSKLSAALLAAVLTFSVTGCAGTDTSGETASAVPSSAAQESSAESTAVTGGDIPSGTLTFLSWQNETVMQPLLDGFKEKYPDVSVDLIYAPPVQDYVEKFQIMYSTGDLPDVFVTAAENKGEVLDNDIAMDISYLPAFDRMSEKIRKPIQKTVIYTPLRRMPGLQEFSTIRKYLRITELKSPQTGRNIWQAWRL